jgi:16S rRNA (cytosine967-C5)-methyltransferase
VPVSPARQTAFRILCRVEAGRAYAVDLLQTKDVSQLGDADRRLATEIVMGVLRWRGELDFQIERLSGKPLKYFDLEVATILRMGIYQLRHLERIPRAAAVDESVELTKTARKRSAAGLVNAVLRKCKPAASRAGKVGSELPGGEVGDAARRAMPPWLLERWERDFGPHAATNLAVAGVHLPPTTLRTGAAQQEAAQRALVSEGVQTEPGKFSDRALTVCSGNIHTTRMLRGGKAVIQDEASQLVATLLAPRAGHRVLDLCAAPGIKTGQLATDLQRGLLVACDLSGRRLQSMKRLLNGRIPLGVSMHLVQLDATAPLPFVGRFDRILVDAPCSGTGTLARNPEIKWRLQPNDVTRLAGIQARILRNALAVLAQGGRLVYATCSLESEENEDVVERVIGEVPSCQLVSKAALTEEFPALSDLFDSPAYMRTRPDLHGMDGFFAAAIQRVA